MESRKETGTTVITETTTKRVCSRSKEHSIKSATHVTEHKRVAHSGLKFVDSKNLTVVKPFSFDTGPKIKKEKVLPSSDKPVGNQKNAESRRKLAKEQLKITKEVRSRSVSPGKRNAAKDEALVKSPCNGRPSVVDRLASTPTISSALKTKTLIFTDRSPANAPKPPPKVLTGKSVAQPVKTRVLFSNSEKKDIKSKGCESSSAEKCKSGGSKEESTVPRIKVTEPSLNDPELKLELSLNELVTSLGTESPTGSESNHLPNGISLQHCEYSETKSFESTTTKSMSKIPRKKFGAHSGLKFHPNVKKETIPQPFSFDKRCSNSKKENIRIESVN